jgi:uncharacterized protein YeaC (DUF1315 family)
MKIIIIIIKLSKKPDGHDITNLDKSFCLLSRVVFLENVNDTESIPFSIFTHERNIHKKEEEEIKKKKKGK